MSRAVCSSPSLPVLQIVEASLPYPARSKRRWWAYAQGDNGILEAASPLEVFIREGLSGITFCSFLEWPILAT